MVDGEPHKGSPLQHIVTGHQPTTIWCQDL